MKLEYICSGCSFTRSIMIPNLNYLIDRVITDFNKQKPHHQMGFLFNAYTEKTYGEKFSHFPGLSSVHADSGGLQITTLGKPNTPEVRDAVYKVQAKWSTVAMCFDEIFIENTSFGSAARTEISTKTVITGNAFSSGVKCGHNIKRQIDVLLETGSGSGPMLILQGNSFDDFQNYFNGMMSVIPEDYIQYIRGIAPSDTCIGNGVLESAVLCSMIKRLDIPEQLRKNVHLLGVGSFSRLLPALILKKSGFLDCVDHLSYDSTSHTSGFVMGRYAKYNRTTRRIKMHDIDKKDYSTQQKLFDDLWGKYSCYLEEITDRQEFEKLMALAVQAASKISPKHVEQRESDIANFGMFLCTMYQVDEFTDFVDDFMAADDITPFLMKKHYPLYTLRNVKTVEDYLAWEQFAINNRLHSNRIKRDVDVKPTNNLMSLFDI